MEYSIKVRKYMTNSEVPFNIERNNGNAMPLMEMTGELLEETRGMYKMKLHGVAKETVTCMMCGRKLENDISRHYGLGPICGGHFYELSENDSLDDIKEKIKNITWTGWIPKSAIKEIKDENNNFLTEMTLETNEPEETIIILTGKSTHLKCDNSIYVVSKYISKLVNYYNQLPKENRYYNPETKMWELNYSLRDNFKKFLNDNKINYQTMKARQTA